MKNPAFIPDKKSFYRFIFSAIYTAFYRYRKCAICEEMQYHGENAEFCAICRTCLAKHQSYSPLAGSNLAPGFAFYTSLFDYDEETQRIIFAIKYHQNIILARRLGVQLGIKLAGHLEQSQTGSLPWKYIRFIPIPLSRSRLQQRGYNQAREIMRGLVAGYLGHYRRQGRSPLLPLLPDDDAQDCGGELARNEAISASGADGFSAAALHLRRDARYLAMQSAFLWLAGSKADKADKPLTETRALRLCR